MTESARLARMAALFDAAIALDPAARAALLDRECHNDPGLRAELERLLAGDASAAGGAMLAGAVGRAVTALAEPDDLSGRTVGAYHLLGVLGRGGMGTVYLARRSDAAYEAQVAIKVVRAGRQHVDVIRRFRAERQILAGLDHPHIARLLDGGALDDGTPYLVMEYVDGTPIDQYCDETRADIRRRIELVLAVAAAVSHAHRRLVVHRDLKPGNILVTSDGVPKLLDFGIAKLLDPAEQADAEVTTTMHRVMTPAYASPEQVRGEPVTTATDVHALGLLLYELLSGRPAYRFDGGTTPSEIEHAIVDVVPPRPSEAITADTAPLVAERRRTQPDRLRRALRGDLDTIVMMALRKEPNRRYASVEALAADLQAHLDGRPVAARPDRWSYRAGRFVRRHRLASATALLLALVVVAFVSTTYVQARRITRERALATEVSGFLVDMFQSADPWEQTDSGITARELIGRGAARVRTELTGQPLVQADLFETLARTYQRLGLSDSGLALADQALALRRRLGADDSALATTLALRGAFLRDLGRADEAVVDDSTALAIFRSAGRTDVPELGAIQQELGSALFAAGRRDDGLDVLREAVALDRRLLGADAPRTLKAMVVLAGAVHFTGEEAEADSLLRIALAGQRARLGPDHPDIFQTLNTLGVVLDYRDEVAGADSALREAIAMGSRHLAPDHPDLLNAIGNLAALRGRVGPMPVADSMYRDLIARRRAAGLDWAIQASNHSAVLQALGRFDEAERDLLAGIADLDRRVPRRGATFVYLFHRLGGLREARGDLPGSEAAFREAVMIARRVYGDSATMTATMLRRLGLVEAARGDLVEASATLDRALAIRTGLRGPSHPERIESLLDLARVEERLGAKARAAELFAKALDGLRAAAPVDTAPVAAVQRELRRLGEVGADREETDRFGDEGSRGDSAP